MDPSWLFGNLYPNRIMVFIGANVEIKSEETGIERTFRFLQPGGLTAYPPAVELKGLSETTVHGGFLVVGEERDDAEAAMTEAEKELAISYLMAGMLDEAERKLAGLGYANVEFVLGSASVLRYEACFDYILCTNAFHHFSDKVAVFSQVWRSLKPGGIFLLQDICDDFVLMKAVDLAGKLGERAHVGSTTSQGLRQLLVSAGFSEVEVEATKLGWFWGIMIGRGVRCAEGS